MVRKAIRAPEGAFTYKRDVQPLPKIGPFKDRLEALLTENEARPRRERLRVIITTNLAFGEWPTVFGDPKMTRRSSTD